MENCFLSWNGIAAELCTGRAEISLMHNTPHPKMENSTAKVAEDESRILAGSSLVSGVIAPKLSTAAPSSGGGILFCHFRNGGNLSESGNVGIHCQPSVGTSSLCQNVFSSFFGIRVPDCRNLPESPSEEEGERVIVVPHVQNDHCRWTLLLLSCLRNCKMT